MHTAGQGLLVLGCVLAGLRLRPSRALVLLVLVVLVLPAATRLPNGVTALPTATRLTALAVAAGLVRRHGTGPFRRTPLHLAAGAYALVVLATGVLLAGPELSTGRTVTAWLDLLDPLLVGAVALACTRVAGPRAAVRAVAVAALVVVLLGAVEHVTGSSLAARLVGGGPLETRAGQTRVRVGADFALALAWTLAAVAPAVAVQLRRRLPLAVLGLLGCLLVAYWTFSRSAPVGFAVALGVLVLALRDRRAGAAVLVVGALLGVVVAGSPGLRERFTSGVDQGAIDVRGQRAPVVLDATSRHPVAGLGLSGVKALGVPETDDSFLLAYAETGVLGAVALIVLLATGAVLVGRGLRGPPSPGREAAAVALGGLLALVVAGAVFDAFAVRGTAALLALLLAAGLAAAEQVAGPAPDVDLRRDVPHVRVAVVGLAVVAGMGVAATWPAHVAVSATFATLDAADQSASYDEVSLGERLVATTCAVAEQVRRP
ncbi:MAG: O-antigen ligase family protein, partial [Mycobacteriales bacterium]